MKRFINYCLLFLIPVIVFLFALEMAVTAIPNSYLYKYNYVKSHGDSLEVIAIGHSQLYDGFMAEAFARPAFNLANHDQMHQENYFVMKELLPYLPNLKMVIMPIGYIDVANEEEDWRFNNKACYYHEYMNVNFGGHLPPKNYYECFSPHRAYEKAISYYLNHEDIVCCDSLGRESTRYLKDRKEPLGANNHHFLNDYTAAKSEQYYIRGSKHLTNNIAMLTEKGIDIVLVSPPHYWADFQPNKKQLDYLRQFVTDLQQQYPIRYIDMQFDKDFEDKDYFNETHLSEIGAEKFTKKLNNLILSEPINQQ